MPLLTGFVATPLPYQLEQADMLSWIADAHADAASVTLEERARLHRLINRVGCPPSAIARRGVAVDYAVPWSEHVLRDAGTGARTRLFGDVVDRYFVEAYGDAIEHPDDIFHVTCTGYLSPSGAQRIVAAKQWPTRVTHAYQMGCYAAVPAVRLALGALATGSARADVAHTELCSLHFSPGDFAAEQLVVHSLFADGLIRYSAVHDDHAPGLRVRAIHELVVPDSENAMSWIVADAGMKMTLARDVPDRIASALRGFVLELFKRGGLSLGALPDSIVAVHPGGPRIIDRVRDILELDDAQVQVSRDVLRDHGNMSSATLPHIWMRIAADRSIRPGTVVPSLAFGPGLTVCGVLLEKQ